MFGEDAVFYLANGQKKKASLLRQGDIILNSMRRPVAINRIHIIKNTPTIELQLDNGTNSFRLSPNLIVFAHFTDKSGTHSTEYTTIKHVYEREGSVKRLVNLFSPSSNVSITSYSQEPVNQDVYCVHTTENDITMIVNDIIICGIRD